MPQPASQRLRERLISAGVITPLLDYRLEPSGPGRVLDVGCGRAKWPGATGLDISADTDADVVHDLDVFPWPIDDGQFDQVLCQDVIEHVAEPLKFLGEIHRVCRPGARVHVRTPHYTSVLAHSDPTHRHTFSHMLFRAVEQPIFEHYGTPRYTIVSLRLDFFDPFRWIGVQALANRFPWFYETMFAGIFPALNIRAELEVA